MSDTPYRVRPAPWARLTFCQSVAVLAAILCSATTPAMQVQEEGSQVAPPGSSAPDEGELGPLARRTSVSQFGITWTFDKTYSTGRFANGDWWVRGPANIIRIDPPSADMGGRTANGSMIDPVAGTWDQGYDSTMYAGYGSNYRSSLNVALGVSTSRPLRLQAGSSLVSTISVSQAEAVPQIKTAAILTCLAAAPPAGSFRPPYVAGVKTIRFNKSQLDYSQLATLPRVPSTPSLTSVQRTFERPWLDHVPGWLARCIHPLDNMPDYGRDLSSEIGVGALMLQLDFTTTEKATLMHSYVQLGIDLYGMVEAGAGDWSPDGGHASGRKWPILFAGVVLGYAPMAQIGSNTTATFGEDAQTFVVQQTSPGVYNHGYGGYTAGDVGMPEWGVRHATEIWYDDRSWYGNPYRTCCTANAWSGFVLAARIMGRQPDWQHDALFAYMDRYLQIEPAGWTRFWDGGFTQQMWETYRANY